MYKCLDFQTGLVVDLTDLSQCQFAGRNHTNSAHLFEFFCTVFACDCHLGTYMDVHIREMFTDILEYTQVLYDHRIQTGFIIRF